MDPGGRHAGPGHARRGVSIGWDVNSHLRVAGSADTTTPQTTYPSLWTPERGMQRLPTIGGRTGGDFGEAFRINEFGKIVGYTTTARGVVHATLWTPVAGALLVQDSEAAGGGATAPVGTVEAARAAVCAARSRTVASWSRLGEMLARECAGVASGR